MSTSQIAQVLAIVSDAAQLITAAIAAISVALTARRRRRARNDAANHSERGATTGHSREANPRSATCSECADGGCEE
ncbi:hypothetical protein [Micromonospora antibiotica]|uniref:Uncharacterized protein n=1 Tax=Micromonospora antibiotica TaxID=2807623 RepID=A0ABS3V6Z1_9ACTN|nr:hypothetical protein [Micromonospora antibiotica]MBO4161379.1 hypothetical protein [Micromonospora antibiotica]